MEVNIYEATTNLPKLIEQALAGEEVIIANAGSPLVKLVRVEREKPVLDSARGTFVLKDGWDDPLTDAEMEDLFGL